ncbi:YwqI/YxiC family protein [Bacillus altitudinis]|nr:DUF5344 family protein [Bacillus altitudinis]MCY7686353.1 YwqI/YxiC family protein [Bacillus altitudinis]MCY7700527.1 YwqI/YxiC family protein [Bacillus altitudinis]MDC7795223.1 DUF5344 family protein [Bacillus altitudinis]
MNDINTSYTEIIQKQLAQTKQAVNTMMETDKAIVTSTNIK